MNTAIAGNLNQVNTVVRELQKLHARVEQMMQTLEARIDLTDVTPVQREQLETVVAIVTKKFGVRESAVYSRDRHQPVALVRQVCMVVSRRKLGLSVEQTGRCFRRDHRSVYWADRAVDASVSTNRRFAATFEALVAEVDKQLDATGAKES